MPDFGSLFNAIPIVTLDMNGYFPGGSKTFVRQKLVQLELLVSSLEAKMQEKISTVINVYDDAQQSNIVFGPALQAELLKVGAS